MIFQRNLITFVKAHLTQMIFITTNIGYAILLTVCKAVASGPAGPVLAGLLLRAGKIIGNRSK
jgi:hypothetical protein